MSVANGLMLVDYGSGHLVSKPFHLIQGKNQVVVNETDTCLIDFSNGVLRLIPTFCCKDLDLIYTVDFSRELDPL